jgi:cation diffusion facilitator CzcD-associated flavoprotein CzcO
MLFANGQQWSARVLVSGMGGLSRAALPDIPGLASFKGKTFHSQQWDHNYSLEGKRVAVIGTGASAIQFVPQIAPRVAQLDLFQRTPPWIMPKADRAVRPLEQWLFRRLPFIQKMMRAGLYCMLESPQASPKQRSSRRPRRRRSSARASQDFGRGAYKFLYGPRNGVFPRHCTGMAALFQTQLPPLGSR